jgi:nitric oxide reductase subunit C
MSRWTKRAIFCALFTAFAGYTGYVYTAGTRIAPQAAVSQQVLAGYESFQQHNCIACHQFYGLGGYMGPDLTNVVSTPGKGPIYARVFLRAGTARMPDFGLSEPEIDALIAFLEYVDATGKYPLQSYRIRWYGTVDDGKRG